MSYEDQLIKYLAQPENLPVALEIAEHVQKLKDDLHRRFWSLFAELVNPRLAQSGVAESWQYIPVPPTKVKTEWITSCLSPRKSKGKGIPMLQIAFGQATRNKHYSFFHGVEWSNDPSGYTYPPLDDLKAKLMELRLIIVEPLWPGWNYHRYAAESEAFMLKFYSQPEVVTAEIVDDYWKLFLELRSLCEAINGEVKGE